MEQIINNLKAQESTYTQDMTNFLAIAQKAYDLGILLQLHSHENEGEKTFSVRMEYPTENGVFLVKTIDQSGVSSDWFVVDPKSN